jgi:hypothetical protein
MNVKGSSRDLLYFIALAFVGRTEGLKQNKTNPDQDCRFAVRDSKPDHPRY